MQFISHVEHNISHVLFAHLWSRYHGEQSKYISYFHTSMYLFSIYLVDTKLILMPPKMWLQVIIIIKKAQIKKNKVKNSYSTFP